MDDMSRDWRSKSLIHLLVRSQDIFISAVKCPDWQLTVSHDWSSLCIGGTSMLRLYTMITTEQTLAPNEVQSARWRTFVYTIYESDIQNNDHPYIIYTAYPGMISGWAIKGLRGGGGVKPGGKIICGNVQSSWPHVVFAGLSLNYWNDRWCIWCIMSQVPEGPRQHQRKHHWTAKLHAYYQTNEDAVCVCVCVYIMCVCSASCQCEFHMKVCVLTLCRDLSVAMAGVYMKRYGTSHRERGLLRPAELFLFHSASVSYVNYWSNTERRPSGGRTCTLCNCSLIHCV